MSTGRAGRSGRRTVAGVGLAMAMAMAMAMLLAVPVAEAGMDDPGGGARPGRFITEFPITAGAGATFATAGPDGNVWFAELSGDRIGRVTPAGTVVEFPLPVPQSAPLDITVGPDGHVWFSEYLGDRIGRITPAGVITEFPLPVAGSRPEGVTAGPDGNLWFTEGARNAPPATGADQPPPTQPCPHPWVLDQTLEAPEILIRHAEHIAGPHCGKPYRAPCQANRKPMHIRAGLHIVAA